MVGMVNLVTGQTMPAVSSGVDWNTGANYPLSQLTDVVAAVHQQAPAVNVNVVVGGAGLDGSLQTIIDTPSEQDAFAASVGQFAAAYHVNDVELDWEPTTPSAAVDAEKSWLNDNSRAYVLNPAAVRNLDRVTVMAYDLQPGHRRSARPRRT